MCVGGHATEQQLTGGLAGFQFSGRGALRPSLAMKKRSLSFSRSIPSHVAYSRTSFSVGTLVGSISSSKMMELGGFAAVVFGPSLLGFEDVDIAELGVFLLGVDSFVGVASEGVDIAVWGSARPNPIQSFAC